MNCGITYAVWIILKQDLKLILQELGALVIQAAECRQFILRDMKRRVKVFAPCSYLANRERTLEISGPADGCAQIPGEGKEHLELSDYLIASAPKPILILAGRYDFIDYTGTLVAYHELKKIYTSLGQLQKIKLFTYDDGHGISKPKREAAVTWFRKWLYNDSTKITEGDIETLSEKDLFCTKTGQVNSEFPNEVSHTSKKS